MPLIVLDRDGVINYDSSEYIKSPEEWVPIPGSLKAIARLNKAGYQVVIATNQSGIPRGLFDLATLEKIHAKLTSLLQAEGGVISDIFFCAHLPDNGCSCRKPQPGMLFQIREKYAVDLVDVYFIGDSISDLQAAKNAGCKPLLVLTGNGQKTCINVDALHVPVFSDLAKAADFVIAEKKYALKIEAKKDNLDTTHSSSERLIIQKGFFSEGSNNIDKTQAQHGNNMLALLNQRQKYNG